MSWPTIWREILNFKFQISNFKSSNNKKNVIPAPFGLELMAERKAGIQIGKKKTFLDSGSWAGMTLVFILFLSFLLILWSDDKVLATTWSLRLLEGGLLWLLIKIIKPKLSGIFWSLALAGTLQALWGIVQFFTQSTFANKWLGVAAHSLTQAGTSVILSGGENWLRAYGGQVHPNVLGGLLVITCLATIWLYFNFKFQISNFKSNPNDLESRIGKLNILNSLFLIRNSQTLILLLYIIQLAGLFFTFSRGAWLSLGVSLGIWWWQSRCHPGQGSGIQKQTETPCNYFVTFLSGFRLLGRNDIRGLRVVILFTILTFVTLSSIYYPLVQTRIFGGGRLEQQSVEERVGSIKDSQSILARVWWHGVGMGNYTVELQKIQPNLSPRFYQPVHNVFLLIFTELGIVGLILFLCLILFVLKNRSFAISHLLLAAALASAAFDHYLWTIPSMFMLFWFIISITNENIYD